MTLPAVPDTFEWIEAWWGPALRCLPLQAIAPHLFTTRQLRLTTDAEWAELGRWLGARDIQLLTQVHGNAVHAIRSLEGPRQTSGVARGFSPAFDRPEADALVSNDPEIAIAVRAADCVPILIADPATGAVAAAHAGWRGTAAGVAGAAVAALEREFAVEPSALVAAIGPSIGPCCYEVGSELVDAFASAGQARHLVDRWFVSPPARRGEFPASPSGAAGKLRLDTWSANRDQLILAGLDEANVHVCGLCTATHIELFPSYRIERAKAGRMAGVIRASRPLTVAL